MLAHPPVPTQIFETEILCRLCLLGQCQLPGRQIHGVAQAGSARAKKNRVLALGVCLCKKKVTFEPGGRNAEYRLHFFDPIFRASDFFEFKNEILCNDHFDTNFDPPKIVSETFSQIPTPQILCRKHSGTTRHKFWGVKFCVIENVYTTVHFFNAKQAERLKNVTICLHISCTA